jgi:hypothetical protein
MDSNTARFVGIVGALLLFVALGFYIAGDMYANGDAGASWSGSDARGCLVGLIVTGIAAVVCIISALRAGRR